MKRAGGFSTGSFLRNTLPDNRFYLFVFYNGEEKQPAEQILNLSDAYISVDKNSPLSLELKVRVININSEAGHEILKKCRVLREYTQFVETVREYRAEGFPDYMKKAIEFCTKNHILEEYLKRKGSEVMGFLCAEYDYDTDMRVKGQEKYDEGLEDGIEKGIEQGIKKGIEKGIEKGLQKGMEEGMRGMILDNLEEGRTGEVIVAKLVKYFSVSEEEATALYEECLKAGQK